MNKYEEALNHIINCDRKDGGVSYLSDAYRNDISALHELIDNYSKLMKAFNDRKVLIESITNDNGVGIFECEADIWATIGGPIVRLGE